MTGNKTVDDDMTQDPASDDMEVQIGKQTTQAGDANDESRFNVNVLAIASLLVYEYNSFTVVTSSTCIECPTILYNQIELELV